MGIAIMGTGVATGEDRARLAATAAVSSPLLEDNSMQGARGVIINVTGGPDLTLAEVSEASEIIYNSAHDEANIIFGAVVDPQMTGKVKITVIATGFDRLRVSQSPAAEAAKQTPIDLSNYAGVRTEEQDRLLAKGNRVIVSRRRAIDLPMLPVTPAPPAPPPAGDSSTGDPEADSSSPLDVPAFLRRHGG